VQRLLMEVSNVRLTVRVSFTMTLETYLLLGLVQTLLSAGVTILSFIRFRSRDEIIKLIGLVFLVSCLANVGAYMLVKTQTFRAYINIPYPIYSIISLCLYSRLYFVLLHKKKAGVFILVAAAFVVFALINIFFIQTTAKNSYTLFLHSFILIVYCLLYFYTLMKDLPSLHLHHLPMFWFNTGLLIFHAGTLFLFSFTAYLVNVLKNNLIVYSSFHNALSIIEHLIFLVGLYYDLKFHSSKRVHLGSY
jgi:hypothetical protein